MNPTPSPKTQTGSWQLFGLGKVGLPFGLKLAERAALLSAWTRTPLRALAASELGLPGTHGELKVSPNATHVLLAIPDDALGRFIRAFPADVRYREDLIWLHTSGALTNAIFVDAGVKGPSGSCHPLQSMTGSPTDAERLSGAFFAVEGDDGAILAAERVAEWFGGQPTRIPSESKIAYHCAAVLASNGVYALLAAANQVATAASITDNSLQDGLARLALNSATNAVERPLTEAATGPVMRGDAGTVRDHIEWLRQSEVPMEALYTELARQLLQLSEAAGQRPHALSALEAVLAEHKA